MWHAFFQGAEQDGAAAITARVVFREDLLAQEFVKVYAFAVTEPLTKAALKDRVVPDLTALRTLAARLVTANTLTGQDIETW